MIELNIRNYHYHKWTSFHLTIEKFISIDDLLH